METLGELIERWNLLGSEADEYGQDFDVTCRIHGMHSEIRGNVLDWDWHELRDELVARRQCCAGAKGLSMLAALAGIHHVEETAPTAHPQVLMLPPGNHYTLITSKGERFQNIIHDKIRAIMKARRTEFEEIYQDLARTPVPSATPASYVLVWDHSPFQHQRLSLWTALFDTIYSDIGTHIMVVPDAALEHAKRDGSWAGSNAPLVLGPALETDDEQVHSTIKALYGEVSVSSLVETARAL